MESGININPDLSIESKHTKSAFVWTKVMGAPFWVMLSTLSIILYKEFHISPLLLTLFIALKPVTALFAAYWSCFVCKHEKFLVTNLILTNLLRFVPFLFFFYTESPWWMLAAFGVYMTLSRGAVPAWVEVFKRNIAGPSQSKIFALGNTIEYVGATVLPLFIGILLDLNHNAWRILFPLTALLGIVSTLFIVRISLSSLTYQSIKSAASAPDFKDIFLPWKQWFTLLRSRPDFRNYQLGFMLGGAGLMIIQPILPYFFVDVLNLSYTEMILAITVCKGIGFSATSPFWAQQFKKMNIYAFSALVALLAALFPLLLLGAQFGVLLIYIAYLMYGFMQSGSELSWHLSAVTFSEKNNSLPFSEANILSVGIRGCTIPFLGSLIFQYSNSITVMCISCLLCLAGSSILFAFKTTRTPYPLVE
jgi:F0F1-type ATP synthase assembly protein I